MGDYDHLEPHIQSLVGPGFDELHWNKLPSLKPGFQVSVIAVNRSTRQVKIVQLTGSGQSIVEESPLSSVASLLR